MIVPFSFQCRFQRAPAQGRAKKIARWLCYALLIGCSIQAIRWWEGRGEGFRLYKIQENVPYDARWDVSYSEDELRKARQILQQKFYYLGHGFQCYAFESEDKQYVVKFFRYQRLRLPSFLSSLPDFPFFTEWRKNRLAALGRRREGLLRCFKTSWQYAKEETALLFMHLNTTQGIFAPLTLVDLLGNSQTIPLDDYQFMLQKKAVHLKPTIAACMKAGDIEGAKNRISQIFALLLHCAERGIQDTDGALIRKNNLGFLGDKAIYIDGGKLLFKKEHRSVKSFEKDLARLKPLLSWLRSEYPSLVHHFHQQQERVIESYRQFLESLSATSQ